MNDTIRIAFDHSVLTDGVLPDLESPDDIIMVEAPVQQVPTDDDASWGFVKQGRRFPASRAPMNLIWAAALYAPRFGMMPKRTEQFIHLLRDVVDALGDEATPDEVFVTMRDLLAGADDIEPSRASVFHDAWHDLWAYQAQGGIVLDSQL